MKVIFDTSTIQASGFYADSYDFRLFNSLKDQLGMMVYMPAVVIDELKDHLETHITEKLEGIVSHSKNLSKIVPPNYVDIFTNEILEKIKSNKDQIDSLLYSYQESLSQNILHYYNRTIPYPINCTHEYVLSKIRNSKAPFLKGTERGYKDFLIWLSILEVADEQEQTVFITNNINDFILNDKIHPDLFEDAKFLNKKNCKIKVYPSLKAFIDVEITSILPQNTEVFRKIVEDKYKPINITKWCNDNLAKTFRYSEFPSLRNYLPYSHLAKEIYIYDLEIPDKAKLLGVFTKEDKIYLK